MARNPNSLKNLKDINETVPPEKKKEAGRKGGIRSGEVRRQKKEMQAIVKDILEMSIHAGKTENFTSLADSNGKNITIEQALILAQVKQALKGNTRAMEFLRDTAGMKPVDKQEVKTDMVVNQQLADILKQIKE